MGRCVNEIDTESTRGKALHTTCLSVRGVGYVLRGANMLRMHVLRVVVYVI